MQQYVASSMREEIEAQDAPSARLIAAEICSRVFESGKLDGAFVAPLDTIAQRVNAAEEDFARGLRWAEEQGWLRTNAGHARLCAGGIYAAKLSLNLPT
jgi:hypothetical protein